MGDSNAEEIWAGCGRVTFFPTDLEAADDSPNDECSLHPLG